MSTTFSPSSASWSSPDAFSPATDQEKGVAAAVEPAGTAAPAQTIPDARRRQKEALRERSCRVDETVVDCIARGGYPPPAAKPTRAEWFAVFAATDDRLAARELARRAGVSVRTVERMRQRRRSELSG